MTNTDFIAGYHAGYKAAIEHLNAVPGLVLPGNVVAMLGDDTRRNGLAESAAPAAEAPAAAEDEPAEAEAVAAESKPEAASEPEPEAEATDED